MGQLVRAPLGFQKRRYGSSLRNECGRCISPHSLQRLTRFVPSKLSRYFVHHFFSYFLFLCPQYFCYFIFVCLISFHVKFHTVMDDFMSNFIKKTLQHVLIDARDFEVLITHDTMSACWIRKLCLSL